jgi:Protein of unknown function (DUF664)
MTDADPKVHLHHYLQVGRDALLWKLDGLGEYDIRRPLTPTGTNLLGLLKHLAYVEMGYFGPTFGRPVPEVDPWLTDDVEENADMWATADESRDDVLALYRRAWAVTDATVEELPLEAPGSVPWWDPDKQAVTLHQILIRVVAETHRHAGHADIVRELIDGASGWVAGNENMPEGVDAAWWESYRGRLEATARQAAGS